MAITEKKKKITLYRSPRGNFFEFIFGRSKKIGQYEADTFEEAVDKYAVDCPHVDITVRTVRHYKIGKDDLLYSED